MTGYECFNMLSFPDKNRFVDNMGGAVSARDYIECDYIDFESFLLGSFDWSRSPEGDVYWRDISLGYTPKTPIEYKLTPFKFQ